ncbi:MAG: response regulator, partial [Planctomycetota bacterium]
LRKEKADAVILDLMIDEDDDGFVLAYKAKKANPEMPVIMVTNIAGETGMEFGAETEEEQSWVKADVVLSKPVRAEQVIGELKRLIGE